MAIKIEAAHRLIEAGNPKIYKLLSELEGKLPSSARYKMIDVYDKQKTVEWVTTGEVDFKNIAKQIAQVLKEGKFIGWTIRVASLKTTQDANTENDIEWATAKS